MKKKKERVCIDGQWFRVSDVTGRPSKVPLTRASNTMTEAELSARILSALRGATKFWKPRLDKLNEGRRAYKGTNKNQKWEFSCEQCKGWFVQTEIEIDHIEKCGGISGENWLDKIKGWVVRAFVEIDGFQRLCKNCHKIKGAEERKK